MSQSDNERLTVYFSGHVQGVGFRFTVCDLAGGFPGITGEVRNLRDGRVELTAEGPDAQLDAFLESVRARMRAYIGDAQAQRSPATGEFSSFGIGR